MTRILLSSLSLFISIFPKRTSSLKLFAEVRTARNRSAAETALGALARTKHTCQPRLNPAPGARARTSNVPRIATARLSISLDVQRVHQPGMRLTTIFTHILRAASRNLSLTDKYAEEIKNDLP
jgi:hypothetical protein